MVDQENPSGYQKKEHPEEKVKGLIEKLIFHPANIQDKSRPIKKVPPTGFLYAVGRSWAGIKTKGLI
ncbi:hypothetical protein GCM10023188_09760 [Pontibacter saemangeumensis]|uniref:Uncharacterized protein n=1 Tax=Pontibacter saemangeumensis TaxID=1084525 RepID=A0ABP8LDV4_9BACT